MNHQIFEEESSAPVSGGMTDARAKIEKQARQLAYDTRYDVKKGLGDEKVDPQRLKGEFIKRLQRSSASSAVKLRAKQMLLGEDYIIETKNLASKSVAKALFKVFVEGNNVEPSDIELNYLKELAENPDKKYKVRVTDKKTGNSYVRYATREKINQLRSNPNISSVEMTEYGEPREGEKNRGEQTAATKAGRDYDHDGNVESGAKEYRGAVHNAIQRKRGLPADGKDTSSVRESKDLPGNQEKIDANKNGKVDANDFALLRAGKSKKSVKEEFIGEVKEDGKKDNKKITGENVDNSKLVKVFPEIEVQEKFSSYEIFRSMVQEKMDLAKAEMGDVVKDFYKSDAPQFKGKSKKKRQQMAIAAKLEAERQVKEAVQGGSAPNLPARVVKFVDELPQKIQQTLSGAKTKPTKPVKEEMECGSGDKDKEDVRSMPTKVNLVKNKLRAMGLKMSYEPEGEVVEERNPEVEKEGKRVSQLEREGRGKGITDRFREKHPGSRQPKKAPGAKETPEQRQRRLTNRQVGRVVKHGHTARERRESEARTKYDTPRD